MKTTVECRGRIAEVEITGDGPDVVYVGTAVPMMWTRPSAKALAASGFRVTNFDYGSGSTDTQYRTAIDQSVDVLEVMDEVGIEHASLVGLSRGAMSAFAVAAQQPERVDSLMLMFPVAGWMDTMMIVDPDPQPVDGETEERFMRRMLATIFSEEFLESNLADAVTLVTTPPGTVARVDRSAEDTFPDEWSVTHPTLVIEGGSDQIVLAPHPKRYLEAIPGSSHVVVPNAAHGWSLEQPEEAAAILCDFLR